MKILCVCVMCDLNVWLVELALDGLLRAESMA